MTGGVILPYQGRTPRIADDVFVAHGAVIEGGAMLTPGKRTPHGELWAGRPARFARALTAEELDSMPQTIENYVGRAEQYLKVGIGRVTV